MFSKGPARAVKSSKSMTKASVIILAYNHEQWIDEAIASVVGQSIAGDIEVIAHDDCSTDQTFAKLTRWRDKYPALIRVFRSQQNLGSQKLLKQRFVSLINEECRGAYLHVLEGDDFWVDKEKLEKQIRFLDANIEWAMCFHNVNLVSEDGAFVSELIPSNFRRDVSQEHLRNFQYAYLHMNSLCFRNVKPTMPGEFYLSKNGDMFFPFAYGRAGAAKFLENVTPSAYRQTNKGAWTALSPSQKAANKLQTAALITSCLISDGNTNGAIAQVSGRVIPNANNVIALAKNNGGT